MEDWEDVPIPDILKKEQPKSTWDDEDVDDNAIKESLEDEDEPEPKVEPPPEKISKKSVVKTSEKKGKAVEVAKVDPAMVYLCLAKYVQRVEGIMSCYAAALHSITLAGPTLFGPVITKAGEIGRHALTQSHPKYYALLIITDGVVTDLQETADAIVKASDLPLSILIVGVGGADFKQMEFLDADNGKRLESSSGRVATRDIVQFVPMREVHGGQASVVQSLLEELPSQFLTYMCCRDIKPLNSHSNPPLP